MSDLANRFESIIYAPDLSTDERRSQLLAWALNNRLEILERLREPEVKPEFAPGSNEWLMQSPNFHPGDLA